MVAALATLFFVGVVAFAVWAIVDTARPRLGRFLFLLEYGPVIGAELPPAPRVMVRGRSVPVRMQVPARLRAAA